MKTIVQSKRVLFIVGSLLALLALAACSGTASAAAAPADVAQPEASTLTTDGLTEDEIEGLRYMREEEKLARDVYLTLYETWGQAIFQNIASSEQQHMDMVLTLLNTYGIEDPAAGNDVGEFTNPELQALYDQLVAQGRQSLADALKVGAAIEEIDILDLQARLAQTDRADIQTVYENLMHGSENHLRAFAGTLERQTGEVYQPQYLSPEAYEAILQATSGQNGQGRGRGRGAGQGQGWGRVPTP